MPSVQNRLSAGRPGTVHHHPLGFKGFFISVRLAQPGRVPRLKRPPIDGAQNARHQLSDGAGSSGPPDGSHQALGEDFRKILDGTTTRTNTTPSTQTIAAPMGRSALAVMNKLTTLAPVAIPQPTANRAGIEFTR